MKWVGVALIALGILFIMGTAGSSDQGLLTMREIITRVMIGMVILGAGIVTTQIANEIEHINKRKDRRK